MRFKLIDRGKNESEFIYEDIENANLFFSIVDVTEPSSLEFLRLHSETSELSVIQIIRNGKVRYKWRDSGEHFII